MSQKGRTKRLGNQRRGLLAVPTERLGGVATDTTSVSVLLNHPRDISGTYGNKVVKEEEIITVTGDLGLSRL